DVHRAVHVETMQALTAARRSAATAQDALLADYQLFHLEADLRWMDHAEARLAALAAGGRAEPAAGRRGRAHGVRPNAGAAASWPAPRPGRDRRAHRAERLGEVD